jgi:hypothetical protein
MQNVKSCRGAISELRRKQPTRATSLACNRITRACGTLS